MSRTGSGLSLCALLSLITQSAEARTLAYVRENQIYTQEISDTGELRSGSRPRLLYISPKAWEISEIAITRDGKHVAVSLYHNREGRSDLWLLSTQAGGKPIQVGAGRDPAFAPNGRELGYTRASQKEGIWDDAMIFDLVSRHTRLLRKSAEQPRWSADGKEIMLLARTPDASKTLLIVDAATGKKVHFKKAGGITLDDPVLSPNGRFIAHDLHLSRPKLNAVILHRNTGREFATPHVGEPVQDWSPDSRWLLWTRWIVDPENDGSYLRLELWLTASNGLRSHRVAPAAYWEARFTPDGKHILYLRPSDGRRGETRNLTLTDLNGKRRKTLLRKVDDFAF